MSTFETVLVSAVVATITSVLLEGLKVRIASKLWLAQEKWKVRKDTYTALLHDLNELQSRFFRLADPHRPREADQELTDGIVKGFRSLASARDVAALWLDADVTESLRTFGEEANRVWQEGGDDRRYADVAGEIRERIVRIAKKDLRMDVEPWV